MTDKQIEQLIEKIDLLVNEQQILKMQITLVKDIVFALANKGGILPPYGLAKQYFPSLDSKSCTHERTYYMIGGAFCPECGESWPYPNQGEFNCDQPS